MDGWYRRRAGHPQHVKRHQEKNGKKPSPLKPKKKETKHGEKDKKPETPLRGTE